MEPRRSFDKKKQKTIKIQSQSPYEILDSAFESRLTQIKAMWPLCKKCDVIMNLTMDFFSNSKNPYVDALRAMTLSGDFYTGKQNSLAYNLMDSFSLWIKPKETILAHLLTNNIKYDAFNLVIKQKNQALISLVATIYKMLDSKEIFVKSIEHLIQTSNYKEACQYAIMLQLHNFKVEDFVIPLIFQDKYSVAEKFLKNNKELQLEVAQFLDNLLGKDNIKAEAEYIIRSMKISDCKTSHLHYKPLSKLVGRVLKAFNLPLSTCPNLMKKKAKEPFNF